MKKLVAAISLLPVGFLLGWSLRPSPAPLLAEVTVRPERSPSAGLLAPSPAPSTWASSAGAPPAAAHAQAEAGHAPASSTAALQEQLQRARLDLAREASRAQLLESRLEDLVRKAPQAEEVRPDGRVASVDARLGTVTIDLGWNSGLARGTHFTVYRRAPAGRREVVGLLRVEEVLADRAYCASLSGEIRDPSSGEPVAVPNPLAPPKPGDLLHSPFFDPRGARTFVVLGSGTKGAFTASQLKDRIQELGGELQPEVSVETDFVVRLSGGEGDPWVQDQLEQAALLGAVHLREEVALEYLGLCPYPVSEFDAAGH